MCRCDSNSGVSLSTMTPSKSKMIANGGEGRAQAPPFETLLVI
jgi:hypothetical protein